MIIIIFVINFTIINIVGIIIIITVNIIIMYHQHYNEPLNINNKTVGGWYLSRSILQLHESGT